MNNLKLFLGTLKSINTQRAYTTTINSFFELINKDETEVNEKDAEIYKATLNDLSSSTINVKISAVKSYFDFLKKIKVISNNPFENTSKPKIKNKEKDIITKEDVLAMMNISKKSRDKAMLSVLVSTGIRISELINLTVDEYNKGFAIITTKGDKSRTIIFTEQTKVLIDEYLLERKSNKDGLLFVSNGGTAISSRSINNTWQKLSDKADLNKKISSHSFRHLVVTEVIKAHGIDRAKEFIGHSDIGTTMRYNHISPEELVNISQNLF